MRIIGVESIRESIVKISSNFEKPIIKNRTFITEETSEKKLLFFKFFQKVSKLMKFKIIKVWSIFYEPF